MQFSGMINKRCDHGRTSIVVNYLSWTDRMTDESSVRSTGRIARLIEMAYRVSTNIRRRALADILNSFHRESVLRSDRSRILYGQVFYLTDRQSTNIIGRRTANIEFEYCRITLVSMHPPRDTKALAPRYVFHGP